MNDNEINIAIAEAVKWRPSVDSGICWDDNGNPIVSSPSYTADLNAMHEAEKVIAAQSKEHDYWFFVRQIIGFSDAQGDWDEVDHFKAIHATARQRAEAFLRTLGKWKD